MTIPCEDQESDSFTLYDLGIYGAYMHIYMIAQPILFKYIPTCYFPEKILC